jgi:hypothetical protein
MKRIFPALVVALVLAVPATASAKRLTAATVCGSSGCNTASDPSNLLPAMEGGPPSFGGPARAHPFYRLVVVVGENHASEQMKLVVVPRSRYVYGPDAAWRRIDAPALRQVLTLAHGLRPFPASRLPGMAASTPSSHGTPAPAVTPQRSTPSARASFPWLAVASAAVTLLIVSGLVIAALRARGFAIWTRTMRL